MWTAGTALAVVAAVSVVAGQARAPGSIARTVVDPNRRPIRGANVYTFICLQRGRRGRRAGVPARPQARRVTLSRKSYDHEFYLTWRRGDAALRLGYGPHMTDGLPSSRAIAGLRDVDDRDLRFAVDAGDVLRDLRLTDYRGVRPTP
jgi:hypothetical protein